MMMWTVLSSSLFMLAFLSSSVKSTPVGTNGTPVEGAEEISKTTNNQTLAACEFPFHYDGNVYYGCVADSANSTPWCVVAGSNNTQIKVDCLPEADSDIVVETYTGKHCHFPFIHHGRLYHGCTSAGHPRGKVFCATVEFEARAIANDSDPSAMIYDLCRVQENNIVSAFGGNTINDKCVFPFNDGEDILDGCSARNSGYYWCPTTDNYQEDKKWGYCNFKDTVNNIEREMIKSNTNGTSFNTECVFPFKYGNVWQKTCIGKGWCSTTSDYDTDKQWIWCDDNEIIYGHNTNSQETLNIQSDTDAQCIFPYVRRGVLTGAYLSMGLHTMSCRGGPRMSYTEKFVFSKSDNDRSERTRCKLPFYYGGSYHYNCIVDPVQGHAHRWCATSTEYDSEVSGKSHLWDWCR